MDIKYKKEKALQSHYSNINYYSPLVSKKYFKTLCKSLGIVLNNVDSVLDLGCGDGRLCQFIPSTTTYTGIDYSINRIKAAKKAYPLKKFINKDLHTFVENTTLNPTLVICVEVLEHLESPKNLLHLIKTKMPNSIIIGTVPINMPYIAHLQVWENEAQLVNELNPSSVIVDAENKHWMCKWINEN